MDTPAKNKMTIALLTIPFAIVGIAIAIVPLVIGMNYQDRTESHEVPVTRLQAFDVEPTVEVYEHAA
jgi:hypothetical protein